MTTFYTLKRKVYRVLKKVLLGFGILALIMLLLSFTDLPFHAYYKLGVEQSKLCIKPTTIVVLGGSGMPSPDGLIRTYYASNAAEKFSNTEIIIAHPMGKNGCRYQLKLMARELILKGIDSTRILYEPYGYNTRTQALNVANLFDEKKSEASILIITSPEHMYRSVKSFKKVGFKNVGGIPAFEKPIEEIKLICKKKNKKYAERSLTFRYNMWSYLQYEILVLREYCAIVFYKLKGWI